MDSETCRDTICGNLGSCSVGEGGIYCECDEGYMSESDTVCTLCKFFTKYINFISDKNLLQVMQLLYPVIKL